MGAFDRVAVGVVIVLASCGSSDGNDASSDNDTGTSTSARVVGLDAMGCEGDEAFDDSPTDAVLALWFEYNSSEGNCPAGGLSDRIGYFRNFAALHTPMPDGIVSASATSLVVADTEILIQPRP